MNFGEKKINGYSKASFESKKICEKDLFPKILFPRTTFAHKIVVPN